MLGHFGNQNRHAQTNRQDEVNAAPELLDAAEAPRQELHADRHEAQDHGVEHEPQRAGMHASRVERIHMGLGRSFKAPKISPKNGTPFPFCAFSPPSAASFSSCSFTKVSAMVVTVSKRATEMKKQLLRLAHDVEDPKPDDKNSNGTGLSGFVEAVAGGVADISGEANEEDSENDEQGAGGNKGATATETPSAIVAVVADQGLNNHAGDGPTKPHKGREFVRDSEQLNDQPDRI
nr:hypothetical protein TEA_019755 [Ipomoea batatas]